MDSAPVIPPPTMIRLDGRERIWLTKRGPMIRLPSGFSLGGKIGAEPVATTAPSASSSAGEPSARDAETMASVKACRAVETLHSASVQVACLGAALALAEGADPPSQCLAHWRPTRDHVQPQRRSALHHTPAVGSAEEHLAGQQTAPDGPPAGSAPISVTRAPASAASCRAVTLAGPASMMATWVMIAWLL